MLTEKQTAHEYLQHLKIRAQGQQIMAEAGTGEDRTEEIIEELGEISKVIHEAYTHALAALLIRIQAGAGNAGSERKAATG